MESSINNIPEQRLKIKSAKIIVKIVDYHIAANDDIRQKQH